MAENGPLTPGDSGPDEAAPKLPPGWIAQWDTNARAYYFVAIATSQSQWEIPKAPAPGVPDLNMASPMSNSAQPSAYPKPGADTSSSSHSASASRGQTPSNEGERGLGTTLLSTALGGGNKPQQGKQSGLMGMAQSFLGSGGSNNSHGSSSGGSHGMLGQLAGAALGTNKPHGQGSTGNAATSGASSGGLGGFFSGHNQASTHNSQSQHSNYGYTTGGSSNGYSNSAPPAQYQAPTQHAPPSSTGQSSQYIPHHNPNSSELGAQQPFYVGGYPEGWDEANNKWHDEWDSVNNRWKTKPQGGHPPQGYQSGSQQAQHYGQHGNYAQPNYNQHQQSNQYPPPPPNDYGSGYGGGQSGGYNRPPPGPPPGGYQHQQQGHSGYQQGSQGGGQGYYGGPENYGNHQHNQYGNQPPSSYNPSQPYSQAPHGQPNYPPPPGVQQSYGGGGSQGYGGQQSQQYPPQYGHGQGRGQGPRY